MGQVRQTQVYTQTQVQILPTPNFFNTYTLLNLQKFLSFRKQKFRIKKINFTEANPKYIIVFGK